MKTKFLTISLILLVLNASDSSAASITGNISLHGTETIIFANGDTVNGNITLNDSSSINSFAENTTINGNIILNNSRYTNLKGDQILLGSAIFINKNNVNINGDIIATQDSFSNVVITDNAYYTANGNFGSQDKNIDLVLYSGTTYDAATNNKEIYSDNITIGNNGATLIIGTKDVHANEIINLGTIKFGDNTQTIHGNILNYFNATLYLGSVAHNVSGDVSIKQNNTINTNLNNLEIGNLKIAGNLDLAQNVNLNVISSLTEIGGGDIKDYKILSAANGSTLNNISVGKLNITSSDPTQERFFSYQTLLSDSGNDLILRVRSRAPKDASQDRKYLENTYRDIENIDNAQGDLATLQNYLQNFNTTNQQRREVLETVTPNNIGLNQVGYNAVGASFNNLQNRIELARNILLAKNSNNQNAKFVDASGNELVVKNLELAQNDNNYADYSEDYYDNFRTIKKDYAVWAQYLQNKQKQKDGTDFVGYKSNLSGASFGFDKISNDNTAIGGISFTFANSTIKTNNQLKQTDVEVYQTNLYGEKFFGNFFIDGLAGFAFNHYNSNRIIPLTSNIAKAQYNGQTYSAKLRAGYIHKLGNFQISEDFSATYAYNAIDNYKEKGANELNLRVLNQNSQMLEVEPGISFAYDIGTPNFFLQPKVKLSYGYDTIGNKQTSVANFVGQTTQFNTETSKINRETFRINSGLNLYGAGSLSLSANHIYEIKRNGYKANTGVLKIRYEF